MPRILVVDDEPEIVRCLVDNLRFEGYQILTATNGADGLALGAPFAHLGHHVRMPGSGSTP